MSEGKRIAAKLANFEKSELFQLNFDIPNYLYPYLHYTLNPSEGTTMLLVDFYGFFGKGIWFLFYLKYISFYKCVHIIFLYFVIVFLMKHYFSHQTLFFNY